MSLEDPKIFYISLSLFPYNKKEKYPPFEKTAPFPDDDNDYYDDKIQFVNNNNIFQFTYMTLIYYVIRNNQLYMKKSIEIDISHKGAREAEVIDLNDELYGLIVINRVFLINKSNLIIAQRFSLFENYNVEVFGFLRISNNIISLIFENIYLNDKEKEEKSIFIVNYDILNKGVNWKSSKIKKLLILEESAEVELFKDNHYLLIGYNWFWDMFQMKITYS